jgi:glycosyltransferase involved in cell wall biosynthesis
MIVAKTRMLQLANYADPLFLFHLPICDALREAGWDVELACMEGGPFWDRLSATDYRIHALPRRSLRCPVSFLQLRRDIRSLFRRTPFNALVVTTPVASWAARQASRGLDATVVYFAHGLAFAPVQSPLMYRAMRAVETYHARYTDAAVVMNQADEEACRSSRLTRTGQHNYRVSGEGVDFEHWSTPPPLTDIQQLERELDLRHDRPLVLYLGRFIRTKRPGDVIALARHLGKDVDVVMAGSGPLWDRTRRQAEQLGPHVKVLAFTDKVRQLVHRSSVLVLPTTFPEGMPRVLLEAQAAQTPPVAYDVRGAQDAIIDGQTGRLIPPRDVDAFCQAVATLLADDALREQMGQAGYQRVDAQFRFSAIAAEHVEVFRQITESLI